MEFKEYELEHLNKLSQVSSECTLFLKKNNDFPIADLKDVALYGNGVRHTIKGGTGSGNVDIHIFNNVEKVFESNNVAVTSKKWLDAYDIAHKEHKKDFVKRIKKEAREHHTNAIAYSIGFIVEEGEYDISLGDSSDVAIYVLSRNAGEGGDRHLIKGDYYLTDTEIKTILELRKTHKKFLLVLNVSSVIDITPVLEVENILLLSQLGSLTSETLFDIVTGKKYPSGKLTTTWAKYEDYPHYNEFGDKDDTYYKEGIYVGYKHFDTFNIPTIFEFGYGLSYTDFDINLSKIVQKGRIIHIEVSVKNIGGYLGKEVVQLYLQKPSQKLDNPTKMLVNFAKTKELKPGQSDLVSFDFDIGDFPSFDTSRDMYIISDGIYQLALGNSSKNVKPIGTIEIPEEIVMKKVKHYYDKINYNIETNPQEVTYEKHKNHFVFDPKDFYYESFQYFSYKVDVPQCISELSNREAAMLSCGDIKGTIKSLIGESCSLVVGGAGETCIKIKKIDNLAISMCDGPAGIRITKEYLKGKKKDYKISTDPLWKDLALFFPAIIKPFFNHEKNRHKKGEIIYQYTTSIPVATALAQSFNRKVLEVCGGIIKNEMEIFSVDVWLAPALNIHRNVLCGRNFEYYSEDPYLSAQCASSIVNSVQKDTSRAAVIKHFACNNQETNRTNSNSQVSMRALREIYLYGFEQTIRLSNPRAVMMSYNLLNGEHTSESRFLATDILRNEWKYDGLIMTDWIVTGQMYNKQSKYPPVYASKIIKSGVNLCMPGGNSDINDIINALANKKLTRDELLNNAAIVYKNILKIKGK